MFKLSTLGTLNFGTFTSEGSLSNLSLHRVISSGPSEEGSLQYLFSPLFVSSDSTSSVTLPSCRFSHTPGPSVPSWVSFSRWHCTYRYFPWLLTGDTNRRTTSGHWWCKLDTPTSPNFSLTLHSLAPVPHVCWEPPFGSTLPSMSSYTSVPFVKIFLYCRTNVRPPLLGHLSPLTTTSSPSSLLVSLLSSTWVTVPLPESILVLVKYVPLPFPPSYTHMSTPTHPPLSTTFTYLQILSLFHLNI